MCLYSRWFLSEWLIDLIPLDLEYHVIELIIDSFGLIFFAAGLPRGLAHQNTSALYPFRGLRKHTGQPFLYFLAFSKFFKINDRLYHNKILCKSVVALANCILILFSELFIQRPYNVMVAVTVFLNTNTPPMRGGFWAPSRAIDGEPSDEFFSATHVNNSSSKIIVFVYETYFLI